MQEKQIRKISDDITNLIKQVHKVSDMTKAVVSISCQLNLLAMNAIAESAREEEAEKECSKDLQELSKVLEETRSSMKNITDIVAQLGIESKNIVKMLESSEIC